MKPEQEHPEATGPHRLLTGFVTLVWRWPGPVLAAVACLCTLSLIASWSRLEYKSQRDDLINPNKEVQRRWRQYLAEFGKDDDMVVVVEGSDRRQMQEAIEALAARVRQQPDRFDRLFYKVDLRDLHRRALLYLPAEQLQQIRHSLQAMNLLLEWPGVGWRFISLASLVREADRRVAELPPDQPLGRADEEFLTQLLSISQAARDTLADPARYRNGWTSLLARPPEPQDLLAEPQYFFSPDGALAFLLVRPINGEQGSFTADQKSIEAMRAVIAEVRADYPALAFGLTGLPVLETDEMVASQSDTNLASWLAMAGVAVLYLIVFRGLRYPLLTVAALLVGIAVSLCWMTLTVGHLNILSAAFAVMLIGMGDYGVLWVTRYEQDRQAGADVPTALRLTAGSVGPGIVTASVTTALAFYATMLADFQAVAELGWIAGSGVLFCAASCFVVIPALLALTDRRPARLPGAARRLQLFQAEGAGEPTWLPLLAGRPRGVIAGSLLLVGVLAVFACRIRYDHNLLHLQAKGLDSVAWEMKLIQHTAGASWHALSYTATPEEARALRARYEQLPAVSRVVEVASLIPSDQEEKLEQLRDIQRRLRNLPPRGATLTPFFPTRSAALGKDLDDLIERLKPLAQNSPQALPAELRGHLLALRDQLSELSPPVADERLAGFDRRLAGDLAADLHRLRDVADPEPITLADLPAALRERYVGSNGKWLLRVFGADCLWEHEALTHFVEEIHRVDPAATGKPFLTLEGLHAMKSGVHWAGVYALLAITAVLLLDFRSVKRTLWALLPLGLGTVATLGLMGLFGVPLNPANMIAFPLILGVGVDNGVHVLHDYLAHPEQRRYLLSRTIGRGILVAALTTVLGFGTLLIASHRGLFGLGLVLSLGVTCCMLTALVFLPALLRLWGSRQPVPAPEAKAEPLALARRAA